VGVVLFFIINRIATVC